jgi:hypothetical protein
MIFSDEVVEKYLSASQLKVQQQHRPFSHGMQTKRTPQLLLVVVLTRDELLVCAEVEILGRFS